MDPQATYDAMLKSLGVAEWNAAADYARDLRQWLDRGGFPPDTTQGRFNDYYWNRRIATYACKIALQIARRQLHGGTRPRQEGDWT